MIPLQKRIVLETAVAVDLDGCGRFAQGEARALGSAHQVAGTVRWQTAESGVGLGRQLILVIIGWLGGFLHCGCCCVLVGGVHSNLMQLRSVLLCSRRLVERRKTRNTLAAPKKVCEKKGGEMGTKRGKRIGPSHMT